MGTEVSTTAGFSGFEGDIYPPSIETVAEAIEDGAGGPNLLLEGRAVGVGVPNDDAGGSTLSLAQVREAFPFLSPDRRGFSFV